MDCIKTSKMDFVMESRGRRNKTERKRKKKKKPLRRISYNLEITSKRDFLIPSFRSIKIV